MKIENNNIHSDALHRPDGTRKAEHGKPQVKGSGSAGRKDEAVLSEEAQLLAKAHSANPVEPVERQEKVERLRIEVQNGTYQVPHHELARRLASRFGEENKG